MTPAIVSPPELGLPYWTAYSPVEGDSSPVDPLRFEMYAERLGNYLFPGITNRVERVRYFGMVCAGLEAVNAEVPHTIIGTDRTRIVRQRFTRFENAWAYADVATQDGRIKERVEGQRQPRLRYEMRGLRGANRVLGYFHKTRDHAKIDGRGGYRLLQAQEAQGGLGAYLVALREHGFVHPDRLEVTAAGAELSQAFRTELKRRHVEALATDGKQDMQLWRHVGDRVSLASPSAQERDLVRAAVFATHRTLGRFVAELPPELRASGRAQAAFRHIATSSGSLAAEATLVLAFDAFRRSCLSYFAAVGAELRSRGGAHSPTDLISGNDLDAHTESVQRDATTVLAQTPVPGIEPVLTLAAEAQSGSPIEVFLTLLDFHRREGRRWLEPAGADRVQLGVPGEFHDPGDGFHGYTLNAALSVYEDLHVES